MLLILVAAGAKELPCRIRPRWEWTLFLCTVFADRLTMSHCVLVSTDAELISQYIFGNTLLDVKLSSWFIWYRGRSYAFHVVGISVIDGLDAFDPYVLQISGPKQQWLGCSIDFLYSESQHEDTCKHIVRLCDPLSALLRTLSAWNTVSWA